jgi:Flp pilus assembly protein TadD
MKYQLIEIEEKALALQRSGQLREAIEQFAAIAKEQPDWEHGTVFYHLACCYEDLSEFSSAEQSYRNALVYQPKNPIFLGGLASFLYLHGDPAAAFEAYRNLLEIESRSGNQKGIQAAETALKALGGRIERSR